MIQNLVLAAVIAVVAISSAPAAAGTRYRTDPSQSFVSFDVAVWRAGDGGTWYTQWEERRLPLNLSFDLDVLDSPVGHPVKRLALSDVFFNPSLPASSPFSVPSVLSWYPGSGFVEWFDRFTYNDGFTGVVYTCACVFVGEARYESGSFDGTRLDVQGGIGPRLSYFSTGSKSSPGADLPPPHLLAQTPVSSAFSYRIVAYPVPEPEAVELLLVGLGLLAVRWRHKAAGSPPRMTSHRQIVLLPHDHAQREGFLPPSVEGHQ